MSRSSWAAVVGASVFAFALTPAAALAASPGHAAASPASPPAKQDRNSGPTVDRVVGVPKLALAHPSRRPAARHAAARPVAPRHVSVLLALGSGYQQAAGLGRVRVLQRRLAGLGFAPGPIDGRYGPLTTDAVERFQSASGLTADGIVGARMLAALSARPSSGLAPGAGYQQTAGSGRVRALQRRLAGLGFAPGPIDGRYGPLTSQAVERFQSARRLIVNGIVGAHTLRALGTARRGRIPTSRPKSHPVPQSHPAPQTHPAPLAGSAPANRQREHSPVKSVTPVLLPGLLVLGLLLVLATISLIYRRTPARRRRSYARSGVRLALAHNSQGHASAGSTSERGWSTRRRRSDRFVPSPEARNNRDEPARHERDEPAQLERQASLAVPLEAQTDMAATLAAYRRADQSGDPTGAFNLGVLLEERGEPDEALAAYRRADQRGHGAAASNLGVLLEERGEPAEAEAAYRRADQRGDPPGAFNLGVLLEERGEPAEAEAAYRRADQPGDGELAKMARAALLDLGGRIQDSKAAQTAGGVLT
jgi:peptidoglycan hydrolase-like protein with peptidoglycan-binding domain